VPILSHHIKVYYQPDLSLLMLILITRLRADVRFRLQAGVRFLHCSVAVSSSPPFFRLYSLYFHQARPTPGDWEVVLSLPQEGQCT
jgi:hypothetical protein